MCRLLEINNVILLEEKFECTKGVTRSRYWKKDRQYNCQKKPTNSSQQNTTQTTNERITPTPVKKLLRWTIAYLHHLLVID
jgi:hypothetical protein